MSYLILAIGLGLGIVFIRAILLKDKENELEFKEIPSSMSPEMQGLARQLEEDMYNEKPLVSQIGDYHYKLEWVTEAKPKKKSSKSKKKKSPKKSKKKK